MNADGDFAANGILIDKALQWSLLVGNYSRLRFHHPGPGLLYLQGWSEWLFYRVLGLLPTSYNGHLLGIFFLNALALGAVGYLLYIHQRSILITAVGLATVSGFLADQGILSSSWMPYVYCAPFLLFLVALSSVFTGRLETLPWLAFAGGLLIHGHVSFFGFVVPSIVVLSCFFVVRFRSGLRRVVLEHAGVFRRFLAILGLFALPVILNLILHFPGEFGRYADYARTQGGKYSVVSVISYHLEYWPDVPSHGVAAVVLTVLATGLAVSCGDSRVRRFELALILTAGLMFVLFVNYGIRGIDDLKYRYIGMFSLSIPGIVTAVIAMELGRRLQALRYRSCTWVAAVLACLVVARVVTSSGLPNEYRGDPNIPRILASLKVAPERGVRPVSLSFITETWQTSVGVMYFAAHHGLRVCASDKIWAFLVSEGFVCTEGELANSWRLVVEPQPQTPGGRVVYEDARLAFRDRS